MHASRRGLMLSTLGLTFAASFKARAAPAELVSRTIDYKQGDTLLEGYLAYDPSFKGRRPGILAVHTWVGVGDYIKMRADMLARLGYVAFAPDIYGKGVRPKPPKETAIETAKFDNNRPLLRARVNAGLDVLRGQPQVDPKKLVAIGYCFGGGAVLELARSGADVLGVVSFHGAPLSSPTPQDAKNIKGRVLVLQGADDPRTPPAQIAVFEQEMRTAKVDWEFIQYGNAVHAFTDKSAGNNNARGAAYNAKADKRSWIELQDFLSDVLKT